MSQTGAAAERRDLESQSLGLLSWPAAGRAGAALLVVPFGATEQHGPHLPLGTDTLVANAICAGLAEARDDVIVAPALPYGSSGEHAGFPGTVSIGQAALEAVVVEIVRSADGFAGTVIVSGHGGNAEPLARALATCTADGRRVLGWSPSAESLAGLLDRAVLATDAHAGRIETSLVLHLAPELVGRAAGTPGGATSIPGRPAAPLEQIAPLLRAHGVAAVSDTGVLGDPSGASAEEGARILHAFVTDLEKAVASWIENAA